MISVNIVAYASKKDKEIEQLILNIPWSSYCAKKSVEYSRKIIKRRWHEAEKKILKSPHFSYIYARHVIKGRWKEAEKIISESGHYVYLYAKYVLKKRFESAENKIKNPTDIYLYSKYVLKKRWIEKEKQMLRSGFQTHSIVDYCKFIIKGRWREAEDIIVKSIYPNILKYTKCLSECELKEFENRLLLQSFVEPEFSWQTNGAKKYFKNKNSRLLEGVN